MYRIVLVEDDEGIARLVKQQLEAWGFASSVPMILPMSRSCFVRKSCNWC